MTTTPSTEIKTYLIVDQLFKSFLFWFLPTFCQQLKEKQILNFF